MVAEHCVDASGVIEGLRDALRQPELAVFRDGGDVTSPARVASYWVAVALGKCRLFGIEPPGDLDGTLSVRMAVAVAQELAEFLRQWIADAKSLSDRLSGSQSAEGEEMCVSLVEQRLEAWTALVAINETYVTSSGTQEQLSQALDVLVGLLPEFDEALSGQRQFLHIPVVANLLANWRHDVSDLSLATVLDGLESL